MPDIAVESTGANTYRVTVTEGGSSTSHEVTAHPADVERLGKGASAHDLIRASFRFLLDRERKESILAQFDLTVIERYFPEYPTTITGYL